MARRRAAASYDSVERSIGFFKLETPRDPESGAWEPYDLARTLETLRSLSFAVSGESGYFRLEDGDDLCVLPSNREDAIRLGRVRRSAFPMLETAGNITPLELDEQYGLFESIHVVFFPHRIVGADYNHFGPRINRLAEFLNMRCRIGSEILAFRPLIGRDAVQQLDRLRSVSAVDLKIREDYAAQVNQADAYLGGVMDASNRWIQDAGALFELKITPARTNRFAFAERVLPGLRRLARREDIHEGATKFEVRGSGEDRESLVVNVLRDHLVARKQIVKLNAKSRALHDESAYAAIREAYGELQQDLLRAAEVVVE